MGSVPDVIMSDGIRVHQEGAVEHQSLCLGVHAQHLLWCRRQWLGSCTHLVQPLLQVEHQMIRSHHDHLRCTTQELNSHRNVTIRGRVAGEWVVGCPFHCLRQALLSTRVPGASVRHDDECRGASDDKYSSPNSWEGQDILFSIRCADRTRLKRQVGGCSTSDSLPSRVSRIRLSHQGGTAHPEADHGG